jgi:hypothetical protein
VLGASGLRSPLRLALAIVPATFAVLVAMESIDGRIATGIQPGFASTLGGSIVLGASAVTAIGILIAVALWRGLRALAASQRRITSALERILFRRSDVKTSAALQNRVLKAAEPASSSVLARRAGKRAPPQAA